MEQVSHLQTIAVIQSLKQGGNYLHFRFFRIDYQGPIGEYRYHNNFLKQLKQSIMNYTVSLLTTRPDCQALIDLANKEKDTLAFRKMGLDRKRLSATITSQEIASSLLAITTELQALQSVHDSLPDGTAKQAIFNSIKKNEYKKFLLEQRKENYGVLALLEKEYDIASVDRSIVETDGFIEQVTTRMNEIR
jgi:hypothetical protein